ncbi:GMC family oxidoreductase [Sphingobium sp. AR-3-1]|uniref:GMC family oxidoreductase n=1 Tax=Sphingobium psychrophilum TaxID=2728834 RepID=A0A7X9WZG4_9SPHN|nr:GMC oxidoreductase [Sphingobium psychrophilum]NML12768.1 GMC family oxidoreductase [Sphingobium psychrophilum]
MIADGLDGIECLGNHVCVVGAGPIGLALATRLAAGGERVLLLESGGTSADSKVQALAAADIVEPFRHDDMMVATSRQMGGTSNLWGARVLPYDPIDFEHRSWIGATWPIEYDDISPYFADAVAATASGAPVYSEPAPIELSARDGSFDATPLERWGNIQAAQHIHAAAIADSPNLIVRTHVTVTGTEFAEDGRLAALKLADSRSGATTRLPVKMVVLAAGGLETTRLLLAAQREAPARFGGMDGPLGRYYMGHVVGEISRIVFNEPAVAKNFDFRVDSHGSYVRRRIAPSGATQCEHKLLNCAFWPVVPQIGHAEHDSAILSMIWMVMRLGPVARLLIAEKLRLANLTPEDSPLWHHALNLVRGAPSAVLFGVDFLRKRYDKKTRMPGIFVRNPSGRYGLSYHSEQLPNPDSRVQLTSDCDRLGLPRLSIDLRFLPEDANSVVRTHVLLEQWLAKAKIARLDYTCPPTERAATVLAQARHGAHQIGIARMGTNSHEAVVDRDLFTFDCANLAVASTAVLPTSGQANPTMTGIMLGLRLADRLLRGTALSINTSKVNRGL